MRSLQTFCTCKNSAHVLYSLLLSWYNTRSERVNVSHSLAHFFADYITSLYALQRVNSLFIEQS